MNIARLPATAIAAAIGAALCVLPGLGIRAVLRVRQRNPLDELMIAIALSVITLAAIAGALLAFRSFSGLTLAFPLVVLGLLGIPRGIVLARRALRMPVTLVLALATWPWWWSAARDGAPPSPLFQWYYWDLGRALGTTNGIPSYVTEFGTHIRWLPDYLVFNAYSEAYRSLAVLGSRTNAIVALRIPVVGVPSLDLVAYPLRYSHRLLVIVLDARRREVFHARYRPVPGGVQRVSEYGVGTPAELIADLAASDDDVLLAGDGVDRYAAEFAALDHVELAGPEFSWPSAAALVELAAARVQREEFETPWDVHPMYLRKSDAEIAWDRRDTS